MLVPGRRWRSALTLPGPPEVALVHDPQQAPPLSDAVPLLLAGHTRDRAVRTLEDDTPSR